MTVAPRAMLMTGNVTGDIHIPVVAKEGGPKWCKQDKNPTSYKGTQSSPARKDAVQSALHLVFRVTTRGLPSTRGSWRYIHTRGGFCGTRRAAEDPSRRGEGSMLP